MKKELKENIKSARILRNLLVTILLMLVIVALCVGLNILIDKLNIPDVDLTQEKLYSLSQESKDKIKSVNKDTKIILYNMDDVKDFAELYNRENSHITCEVLTDVTTRPDLETEYGIGQVNKELIIIENEDRKKALATSDLYTTDYTTYDTIDTTEQALTNAILDVNLESNPKIYFVTNHMVYSNAFQTAKELLKNEANEVEDLDLLVKGEIPADCNVLVLTSLQEDFSEYEKDLIVNYINNGGNMMILAEPNYRKAELPNFNLILDLYGVSVSEGIIFETNDKKMLNGYPNFVLPTINATSSITKYIASDGAVAFMNCGRINYKSDEELEALGVTTENLLTTSSGTFLRNDVSITTASRTESDQDGANSVVAASITKNIGEDKQSKLILCTNDFFASDLYVILNGTQGATKALGITFYNNKDMIINSISYLTERTDNITLRKDTGVTVYTATKEQDKVIKIIITVFPILIIVAGIIVWQMRKRQK